MGRGRLTGVSRGAWLAFKRVEGVFSCIGMVQFEQSRLYISSTSILHMRHHHCYMR